jgi:hypothetical protein
MENPFQIHYTPEGDGQVKNFTANTPYFQIFIGEKSRGI